MHMFWSSCLSAICFLASAIFSFHILVNDVMLKCTILFHKLWDQLSFDECLDYFISIIYTNNANSDQNACLIKHMNCFCSFKKVLFMGHKSFNIEFIQSFVLSIKTFWQTVWKDTERAVSHHWIQSSYFFISRQQRAPGKQIGWKNTIKLLKLTK